jgi:23S rRNA (cytidine1920-2'-O)/16S rRNA (cytidine1409-2'-O)-methyltransferase
LKERLDKLLFSKGLAESREKAKVLILEGKVLVDGQKITKAGTSVNESCTITIKEELPFVSRGGIKLDAALAFFSLSVTDAIIMDVGSSTGGFTDCLLKRGAGKVYCIDVGYGQLAWSLRTDQRVVLMERVNVRYLDRIIEEQRKVFDDSKFEDLVQSRIDLAVIDVSFISLKKVIPAVVGFLKNSGSILALIKPQFEIGKGEVGKGGIVRDENSRLKTVEEVREASESLDLQTIGFFESPLPGQKGNIEYFLYMKRRIHGRS